MTWGSGCARIHAPQLLFPCGHTLNSPYSSPPSPPSCRSLPTMPRSCSSPVDTPSAPPASSHTWSSTARCTAPSAGRRSIPGCGGGGRGRGRQKKTEGGGVGRRGVVMVWEGGECQGFAVGKGEEVHDALQRQASHFLSQSARICCAACPSFPLPHPPILVLPRSRPHYCRRHPISHCSNSSSTSSTRRARC